MINSERGGRRKGEGEKEREGQQGEEGTAGRQTEKQSDTQFDLMTVTIATSTCLYIYNTLTIKKRCGFRSSTTTVANTTTITVSNKATIS